MTNQISTTSTSTITISFRPIKLKLFLSKKWKKTLLVIEGICINGSSNRILPGTPGLIHVRQESTTLPTTIDSVECLAKLLLKEQSISSQQIIDYMNKGCWIEKEIDTTKRLVINAQSNIERNRRGDRLIECTEVLALQNQNDESYLPIGFDVNVEYNEYVTPIDEDSDNNNNGGVFNTNTINVKSERHKIFAHWLVETYGKDILSRGSGVLDVAGGNGMISRTLCELGIPATLVDPNPRCDKFSDDSEYELDPATATESTNKSTLFKVIPHPLNGNGEDLLTSVDDDIRSTIKNCSLICGLHPDQATEPIVTLALSRGVPFAIAPCCVMPCLFPHRVQKRFNNASVRSYSAFCQYLLDMAPNGEEFKVAYLPFVGRNKVIYRIVGTPWVKEIKPRI